MECLTSTPARPAVDLHSHILPGVDDGARTIDQSAEMLRIAAGAGTTDIVATPHFNSRYAPSAALLRESLARLREAAPAGIAIHQAYEILADPERLERVLADPSAWAIGGGPNILIEFDDGIGRSAARHVIAALLAAGLAPVIAHPERNPVLRAEEDLLREWTDSGVLLQLTAGSFCGRFGAAAKHAAVRMVRKRLAHVVAGDGHDPVRRPPISAGDVETITRMFGRRTADLLLYENPSAVLNGRPAAELPGLAARWLPGLFGVFTGKPSGAGAGKPATQRFSIDPQLR